MASPVGHSLFGYGIYSAVNNQFSWKEVFIYIILANLADFDYLFGFLVGEPNKYHHQFMHSILISVVTAGIFAVIFCIKKREKISKIFVLFFLVYFSHVLIDFFTLDTSFPFGEQLFWPFSDGYYISSFSIFADVQKANTSVDFFSSLFSTHNLLMVLSEIGIFGTFCLIVNLLKRQRLLLTNWNTDK